MDSIIKSKMFNGKDIGNNYCISCVLFYRLCQRGTGITFRYNLKKQKGKRKHNFNGVLFTITATF